MTSGNAISTNEEYDPTTDTWDTSKAPMPTARFWHASGVVNNRIYLIGGNVGSYPGSPTTVNEEYDPTTDSWSTKASIPKWEYEPAAGTVNNKIYVIANLTNYEYAPTTNKWVEKTPMLGARSGLAIGVVNNKIYAIGGSNATGVFTNTNEVFELCTATATVSFYDGDPDAGGTLIGQQNITLWGNASATASIEWTPASAGTHDIYVRIENVTPGDANESNNVAYKSITVEGGATDFCVEASDISFSDSTPTAGEDIYINATVTNLGNATGDAVVKFWDRDPTTNMIWTKEDGVRVDCGGTYDSVSAVCPDIIQLPNGSYRMYYYGSDGANYRILSAISTDGLTWTKESGVRVDIGGPYDSGGATDGHVIKLPNGTYRMYYHGTDGAVGRILSAISSDGINWVKEDGVRIDSSQSGSSDVGNAEVLLLQNGTYRMYYKAYDGVHNYILSALSTDSLSWYGEPGVRINYGGTYDSLFAWHSSTIQLLNGTYRMYYSGYDGTNHRILSAWSSDGINWLKENGIRINIGGTYDLTNALYPYAMKLSDGSYRMYYSGSDGTNDRILSATASINATQIGSDIPISLAPGASQTVSVEWTATAGTHDI